MNSGANGGNVCCKSQSADRFDCGFDDWKDCQSDRDERRVAD